MADINIGAQNLIKLLPWRQCGRLDVPRTFFGSVRSSRCMLVVLTDAHLFCFSDKNAPRAENVYSLTDFERARDQDINNEPGFCVKFHDERPPLKFICLHKKEQQEWLYTLSEAICDANSFTGTGDSGIASGGVFFLAPVQREASEHPEETHYYETISEDSDETVSNGRSDSDETGIIRSNRTNDRDRMSQEGYSLTNTQSDEPSSSIRKTNKPIAKRRLSSQKPFPEIAESDNAAVGRGVVYNKESKDEISGDSEDKHEKRRQDNTLLKTCVTRTGNANDRVSSNIKETPPQPELPAKNLTSSGSGTSVKGLKPPVAKKPSRNMTSEGLDCSSKMTVSKPRKEEENLIEVTVNRDRDITLSHQSTSVQSTNSSGSRTAITGIPHYASVGETEGLRHALGHPTMK